MFCTNCGRENREQAKFCIYCGTRLETDTGDASYYHKSARRISKKYRYRTIRKRKRACLLLMIVVLIGVLGITLRSWYLKSIRCEKVNEYASEAAITIMQGDMGQVQQIIFGYEETEQTDSLTGEEESADGILQALFSRNKIEVERIGEREITYEITAPDMSKVFTEMDEETAYLQDNFSEYIYSYLLQTENIAATVTVPYRIEDGVVTADYKNKDFINAITGGLLQGYQELHQKMIEEYAG